MPKHFRAVFRLYGMENNTQKIIALAKSLGYSEPKIKTDNAPKNAVILERNTAFEFVCLKITIYNYGKYDLVCYALVNKEIVGLGFYDIDTLDIEEREQTLIRNFI